MVSRRIRKSNFTGSTPACLPSPRTKQPRPRRRPPLLTVVVGHGRLLTGEHGGDGRRLDTPIEATPGKGEEPPRQQRQRATGAESEANAKKAAAAGGRLRNKYGSSDGGNGGRCTTRPPRRPTRFRMVTFRWSLTPRWCPSAGGACAARTHQRRAGRIRDGTFKGVPIMPVAGAVVSARRGLEKDWEAARARARTKQRRAAEARRA